MIVQANNGHQLNGSKIIQNDCDVKLYDVQLEWLQGDGNAYIQTEIYGSEDLDFEVEYIPYSPDVHSNAMTIFGCRRAWNADVYQLTEYRNSYPYGGHFAFNDIGVGSSSAPSLGMVRNVRCTISKHGYVITNAVGSTYSVASHSSAFMTPNPLTIFALTGMTYGNVGEKCKGKICSLKFNKNYQLIADFIPVKKDGVGYLYDKVSKQLLWNKGTGKFILGPVK